MTFVGVFVARTQSFGVSADCQPHAAIGSMTPSGMFRGLVAVAIASVSTVHWVRPSMPVRNVFGLRLTSSATPIVPEGTVARLPLVTAVVRVGPDDTKEAVNVHG